MLSCTFSESRASARSRQINDLGRRFAADAIHGSRSEREIHVSVQQTAFSAACYDASMPLNDFDTPTAWRIDLDERWPERLAIKQAVLDRLSQHVAERESAKRPLRVLELGVGDTEMLGKDATEMLATLQDRNVPTVVYGESSTGVDADEYLVLTQAETSPRDIANGILDGSLSSLINIHRMATRIVRCAERIETVYPGCA